MGVKGQAQFRVWTAPSVAVTTRPSLAPDYAHEFERPGVSVQLPGNHQTGNKVNAGSEAGKGQGKARGGRGGG